jgi:hypothetical protein
MILSLDNIQKILATIALCIGGIYLLGGIIVNLYLARYGFSEYQLVRSKYLAAGLVYIFNTIVVIGLTVVLNVIFPLSSFWGLQLRSLTSFISLMLLAILYYNQKFHLRTKNFLSRYLTKRGLSTGAAIWWLASLGISIYPVSVALSYDWLKRNVPETYHFKLQIVLAILYGVAGFSLMTLYYGLEMYANTLSIGPNTSRFIGTGIKQRVRFVGKPEDIELIKQLGIPTENPQSTAEVFLIDETDNYYLVVLHVGQKEKAAKINRDLVKGIAYGDE